MIALFLLTAGLGTPESSADPAPPTSAEEQEILVLGRRSSWWSGSWESKDGATSCRTTKSTGDTEVDKILCDGLAMCSPKFIPEMSAVVQARQAAGHPVSREDLPKLLKPVQNKIMRCARTVSRQPFLALIRTRKAAGK